MDIEQFYDQNEQRRSSAEVEFGSNWRNARGYVFKLSWVEATGELYVMAAPYGEIIEEPVLGDAVGFSEPMEALTVQVVGTFAKLEEVEEKLTGWQDVMEKDRSMGWLQDRLEMELDF
jgi:hypothetical protein